MGGVLAKVGEKGEGIKMSKLPVPETVAGCEAQHKEYSQ